MALDHAVYRPRNAEASVLHRVIREHLEDFLRAVVNRAAGAGLPEFIAREFREFLTCGVLAHGFARVRCRSCAFERLVPFSPRTHWLLISSALSPPGDRGQPGQAGAEEQRGARPRNGTRGRN